MSDHDIACKFGPYSTEMLEWYHNKWIHHSPFPPILSHWQTDVSLLSRHHHDQSAHWLCPESLKGFVQEKTKTYRKKLLKEGGFGPILHHGKRPDLNPCRASGRQGHLLGGSYTSTGTLEASVPFPWAACQQDFPRVLLPKTPKGQSQSCGLPWEALQKREY